MGGKESRLNEPLIRLDPDDPPPDDQVTFGDDPNNFSEQQQQRSQTKSMGVTSPLHIPYDEMEPSWLDAENDNNNNNSSSSMSSNTASHQNGLTNSTMDTSMEELVTGGNSSDEKNLPQLILTMRILNLFVSISIIVCSVFEMIRFPHPTKWVLAVYATFGSILVCLLETQLQYFRVAIAINFGFLFSPIWRLLFYLLLANIAWSYKTVLGRIMSVSVLLVSLYNTYVLVRYPSYRKVRDRIAEDEDKQIQEKIASEMRKHAMNDLTTRLTGGGA